MKHILKILLLTFILFACKTSYDKSFTLQCNQKTIEDQINRNKIKKQKYLDSIYSATLNENSIDGYTEFLEIFPLSEHIEDIRQKRRKLFLKKENVIKSKFDIDKLTKQNPCYIPIYKNIDYIRDTNISFENLFNSELDINHPYRNRYIVADLNTIKKDGQSRGIKELFFNIKQSWEFKDLFIFSSKYNISDDSLLNINITDIKKYKQDDTLTRIENQLIMYKNYYSQVEKYRKEEIEKKYSTFRGYKYTGQNICFCEIDKDTILLVAKHVTSARGKSRSSTSMDSTTGEKTYSYFEALPTGKDRKYYAAHYRITIRNWETQRTYTNIDVLRDSMTGGGNSRVTYFDGKSQLPNFLLMDADPLYPRAMPRNGIHEGSLSNMSRCMLGTPQSLGCLRTTDYGSKFCRWWIPKYANLFVYYEEDKYSLKQLPEEEIDGIKLPFQNDKEGNLFREWVNTHYPKYAEEIDLEEKGSCSNCFIQLAWEKFYSEYMETKNGRKLDFVIPIPKKENIVTIKQENNKKQTSAIKEEIEEKFRINTICYIVVGCFKKPENAHAYARRIKKKSYSTYVFYDKHAECNLTTIGPYESKEKASDELLHIQRNIEEDAWIFTKIVE